MTAATALLPGVGVCADNTPKELTTRAHWKENEDGNDGNKDQDEEEAHGNAGSRWGRSRPVPDPRAMQSENTEGIRSARYGFERFRTRESSYGKEN